jgi:large subunit ribosomal protein L13
MEKNPKKVMYMAVRGMLPKTMLGKLMLRGLRIYSDDKHEQIAQKPVAISV